MILDQYKFLEEAVKTAGEEILEEVEAIKEGADATKGVDVIAEIVRDLLLNIGSVALSEKEVGEEAEETTSEFEDADEIYIEDDGEVYIDEDDDFLSKMEEILGFHEDEEDEEITEEEVDEVIEKMRAGGLKVEKRASPKTTPSKPEEFEIGDTVVIDEPIGVLGSMDKKLLAVFPTLKKEHLYDEEAFEKGMKAVVVGKGKNPYNEQTYAYAIDVDGKKAIVCDYTIVKVKTEEEKTETKFQIRVHGIFAPTLMLYKEFGLSKGEIEKVRNDYEQCGKLKWDNDAVLIRKVVNPYNKEENCCLVKVDGLFFFVREKNLIKKK